MSDRDVDVETAAELLVTALIRRQPQEQPDDEHDDNEHE